jgi:hypothetical protein
MTKTELLTTIKTSAEARAQGFTTLEWLRSRSFTQHLQSIAAEQVDRAKEQRAEVA